MVDVARVCFKNDATSSRQGCKDPLPFHGVPTMPIDPAVQKALQDGAKQAQAQAALLIKEAVARLDKEMQERIVIITRTGVAAYLGQNLTKAMEESGATLAFDRK